jgi:hypothetical protein
LSAIEHGIDKSERQVIGAIWTFKKQLG